MAALLAGVVLCLAPLAAAQDAAPAADEKAERARALFKQGVADYDAGRYEQALSSFQEAYRIKPHPMVRVNMANCYDKLGKPLQAIIHFERFLASNTGSRAQRKEVKASIARLQKQVGALSLQISPDGAAVVIDKGDRRTAPIAEPVRLAAGKHELVVSLEGYVTERRELEVTGGVTTEVAVTLEPSAPAPAPPPVAATPAPTPAAAPAPAQAEPTAAPAEDAGAADEAQAAREAIDAADTSGEPEGPRGERLGTGVWIAGGATAALLVGATVTGMMALSAEDDFRAQRATIFDPNAATTTFERIDAYNEARDAADRANALALTTDILLGGALIAGALTTYLIFNRPSPDRRTQLTPILGPTTAGLSIGGSL